MMSTAEGPNGAGMMVSVVLCTYNRCKTLATTLVSLAASELPSSETWEVLVVDNNSSDDTRQVVDDFCRRYPGQFRYLFEPKPGKSYALNAGIEHARGEVVAFVDDDVIIEPSWLHKLTSALHDGRWAGAGGRILPTDAFTPPSWTSLEDCGGIIYGRFDFGDQPCELRCAPFGANMAFRKEMFAKYGGFRTNLGPGPDPAQPRPNEDTEFGRRLMAAGEHLRYEPAAVVYHPIARERFDKEYFLSWRFDFGRALTRELENRPDVWGINRDYLSLLKWAIVHLPTETLLWVFSFDQKKRFQHKCRVWQITGQLAELWRRSISKVDAVKSHGCSADVKVG